MKASYGNGLPLAICHRHEQVETSRVKAAQWCEKWVRMHAVSTPRAAAIFDMDSTLLISEGDDVKAIQSICNLYTTCETLGITVFVITARAYSGKALAFSQLAKCGLRKPRHMFLHPDETPLTCAKDAAVQKSISRERIKERQYTVILNAGDATGDHVEEAADMPSNIHRNDVAVYIDPRDGVAHLKLPTIR